MMVLMMRRSQRKPLLPLYGLLFLSVILFSWGCSWFDSSSMEKTTVPSEGLLQEPVAGELNLGPWSKDVKNSREIIELNIDSEGSFRQRVYQFKDWISSQGFKIIAEKNIKKSVPRRVDLEVRQGRKVIQFQIEQKISARLALVIDDLGYSKKALPLLKDINKPVTVAVLPHLAFSEDLARELHQKGFEVILHLPMENEAGTDPGPGAIRSDMSDEEIQRQIEEDLKTVPFAVGVNNHMGSKATQEARVMKVVLEDLRGKNLFFLDSLTTTSVTRKVAQEEHWLVHARDVFIDNQNSEPDIRSQMEEIKQKALQKKQLIAIGHFRKGTLQVIGEYVDILEDAGIQFVPLSNFYLKNQNDDSWKEKR